jgi:glycosyltransferase involved in cell wall biosynthesis
MHIGVHGLRLSGQRFGVGRYIEYVLKHWEQQVSVDERLTVFTRGRANIEGLRTDGRLSFRQLSSSMSGTLWENGPLVRAASEVDVLFCPSYTAPVWGPTALVVVTHSVDEAHPGTHSWWHNQSRARLYRAAARRAAAVIVPSVDTSDAVHELYGVARERIHVIPLGVDTDVFHPLAADDPRIAAARRRYLKGDYPYFLFVGKMSRRRNIPLLLQSFARLKAAGRPHKLLIFGPNHEGLPFDSLVSELGLTGEVVQDDGRIESHRDLVPVYCGAQALIHPTSYDSSSLPVTEALACGVPVVTMATGGLVETCGDAALLLHEWTAAAVSAAMQRVIDEPDLRDSLSLKGRARAEARSWRVLAEQALEVVRGVGRQAAASRPTR